MRSDSDRSSDTARLEPACTEIFLAFDEVTNS